MSLKETKHRFGGVCYQPTEEIELKLKAITAAVVATQLIGCATVVRGTSEPVQFWSSPQGVLIELDNGMKCIAPCELTLPRKHIVTVKASKDCHETEHGSLKPQISGAGGVGLAGNAIVGGVIGVGVDVVSGAMMDLQPNPYKVKLEQDGSCAGSVGGVPDKGGSMIDEEIRQIRKELGLGS